MMYKRHNILLSSILLLIVVAGVLGYVYREQQSTLLRYDSQWGQPLPLAAKSAKDVACPLPAAVRSVSVQSPLPSQTTLSVHSTYSVGVLVFTYRGSAAKATSSYVFTPSHEDVNIVVWNNGGQSSLSEITYNQLLPSLQRQELLANAQAVAAPANTYIGQSATPAVRYAPVLGGSVGSVWQQWLDEYYATGATDLSGLEAWWQNEYGSGYTPDIYTEFEKWAMPLPDGGFVYMLLLSMYVLIKSKRLTV